ncbi:hypothetical protein MMC21_002853 [Puttea exsequens]|nr:hypothetical protein [Puttea exsequens]
MRVLILGAAGRVGAAALAACLSKSHTCTAYLPNPSKLPPELLTHPRLRVHQGEVTSHASLVEAIRDTNCDCVIQAAVYGSTSPYGNSDSEKVVQAVIGAIREVQMGRRMGWLSGGGGGGRGGRGIRLWVMSGSVLMDIPAVGGLREGDVYPIHPEHYLDYEFLRKDEREVDWSACSPGRLDAGEVRVLLYNIR